MAFTSTDQTNVEAAIIALARGQRVVRVQFDDGQTIQYAETDMGKLESLLGLIKSDIAKNSTTTRKRYRHVMTSKGY